MALNILPKPTDIADWIQVTVVIDSTRKGEKFRGPSELKQPVKMKLIFRLGRKRDLVS